MNQKGLTPILIIILIAAALGGLAIYRKQGFQPKSTPSPQPTPQTTNPPFDEAADKKSDNLTVKPAEKSGWNVLSGQICNPYPNICSPSFSIEYPNNWLRDGYSFYPYGKTGSKTNPAVYISTGGSGWPLPIVRKTTTWGELNSSWGRYASDPWYEGFVTLYIGGSSQDSKSKPYVITARFIPPEKAEDFKNTFEQVVSSFKYLGDDKKIDVSNFKFVN